MKRQASHRWLACTVALPAALADVSVRAREDPTAVEVRGGTAAFDVATNKLRTLATA